MHHPNRFFYSLDLAQVNIPYLNIVFEGNFLFKFPAEMD